MKRNGYRMIFVGFCMSFFSLAGVAKEKIKIASFVGVEIGADIGQYEETLFYSRSETRKKFINEIVQAAERLSGGNFNPTGMLGPLEKIQESADAKRDLHKEIDSMGVSFSLGEFFKGEMENLAIQNGFTRSERRIEFINSFPIVNGRLTYNSKAQFNHYIFIHLAHIGRGEFRISGTLGIINESGIERTFTGRGPLDFALKEVAEGIFRSIMEIERPTWKNPNKNLIWVPGPRGISSMDSRGARLYCQGQDARLPLADELISASGGTPYRNGGIERLNVGENYFVGDQMRQGGVNYFVTVQDGKIVVNPVVGNLGKVWCVKGKISEKNVLIQKLYLIRRKLDKKGMNIKFFPEDILADKLQTIKAIESLLIHLDAPGAELEVTLSQRDLMSADEAIDELKKEGIHLVLPQSIL